MPEKGLKFEISIKNIFLGLLSAGMIAMGLFLYTSILNGRLSFENSPYPRQDRGILIILSWIFITIPFLILEPNKTGFAPAIGVFLALYLSFAYSTGSFMVFDASAFIDIAVAAKILIAPLFFVVILGVLLYNAVSGEHFFRSVIFGVVAIGFLGIGSFMGII